MNFIIRYFKRRKCNHEFVTFTNLSGDIVNNWSTSRVIARRIVKCVKCETIEVRGNIDPECEIYNFTRKICKGCGE